LRTVGLPNGREDDPICGSFGVPEMRCGTGHFEPPAVEQGRRMSLITPEIRELVGVDYPPVVYHLDESAIRLWARAAGHTDPVFYDEEYAREAGHPSLPAPPGFVGHERFGPSEELSTRGPPIWELNPKAPRRLNGGTEYEYPAIAYAGDVLVATGRIIDISEREGAIGKMLIVKRETTFRRNGVPVVIQRYTAFNY